MTELLFMDPSMQPFLPFLFVMAITYGLLRIARIFDKDSINVILALVFGLFAAGYPPFKDFFFANFGIVLWAFVILFFIAFFMEIMGLKGKGKGKPDIRMILGTIIVLLLVTVGFAFLSNMDVPVIGTENFLVIMGLILLGLIFYSAYEIGAGK